MNHVQPLWDPPPPVGRRDALYTAVYSTEECGSRGIRVELVCFKMLVEHLLCARYPAMKRAETFCLSGLACHDGRPMGPQPVYVVP